MTITVSVSNSSQLLSAIASRTADTVIVLNPGNYGDVTIKGTGSSVPITLQAASTTSASTFSNLTLSQANGVSLTGLTFTPAASNGSFAGSGLEIDNSSNVVVQNSSFVGGPTAFNDSAYGLTVQGSTNVTVSHSLFTGLTRGGVFLNTNNISVTDNDLTNLRSDGFDFAAVTNTEIASNKFSNFFSTADDHPDAIQFMTVGTTTASANISVHDNIMSFTSASPSQGIFLGNENNIPYKNVSIQNNHIVTGDANGITVANASGVNVSGNTVVAADANSPYKPGIHIVGSNAISINSNTTNVLDIDSSNTGAVSSNTANYITFTSVSNLSNVGNKEVSGMFTTSNTPDALSVTPTPSTPSPPSDTAPANPTHSGDSGSGGLPTIVSFSQDTGAPGDGITNVSHITLQGTAAANSTVKLYDGTKQIATATANANGIWSDTTASLSNGVHSFRAVSTGGSVSAATSVTVDTKAPIAPMIKSFSPDTDVVGDGSTQAHLLTLKGTAEANSTVKIDDGGHLIGSVVATSNGSWSFDTSNLTTGTHAFTATATDIADNHSGASSALTVKVVDGSTGGGSPSGGATGSTGSMGGLTLVTPHIVSVSPDTHIATDEITSANVLTLQGVAGTSSILKVFDGHTQIGTAVTDANGAWSYQTGSLSDGSHSFVVKDTDGASAGSTSTAFTMTVDTAAPQAPTISTFTPDGVTSVNKLMLGGTAEAHSVVNIFDGQNQIGTANTKADGSWSFTSGTLANGNHDFFATSTDMAGNVSAKSVAYVTGTFGSDALHSNSGVNDILIGGPGSDTFNFAANFGKDTVADFVASGSGHDVLSFSKDVFSSFADTLAHAAQVGHDVVLTTDTHDSLTLTNVHLASLQKVDFQFT